MTINTEHFVLTQSLDKRKFSIVFTDKPLIIKHQNKIVGLLLKNKVPIIKLTKPLHIPHYSGSSKMHHVFIRFIHQRHDNLYDLYTFKPEIWDYILPWLIDGYYTSNDFLIGDSVAKVFVRSEFIDANIDQIIILYRPFKFTKEYEKSLQELMKNNSFNEHIVIDNHHDILVFDIPSIKIDLWQTLKDGEFSKIDDSDKQSLISFIPPSNKFNTLIDQILYKRIKLKIALSLQIGHKINDNQELHQAADIEQLTLKTKHIFQKDSGFDSYENLPTIQPEDAFSNDEELDVSLLI